MSLKVAMLKLQTLMIKALADAAEAGTLTERMFNDLMEVYDGAGRMAHR